MTLLISSAGCRGSTDPARVSVVDLIREFDRADRRPRTGLFQVADHKSGGDVARPSIVAPVPSRMTWTLPLPRRGVLHLFVALADDASGSPAGPVRFRLGISDHRIFESLEDVTLTPEQRGWHALRSDLSAYAGWKWSLFYRPDRIRWNVVLAADALEGTPSSAVWGSPEILTDTQSAREYSVRRQRLR